MSYYREIKCPKCGTLVGIKEVNVIMPYKTVETARQLSVLSVEKLSLDTIVEVTLNPKSFQPKTQSSYINQIMFIEIDSIDIIAFLRKECFSL